MGKTLGKHRRAQENIEKYEKAQKVIEKCRTKFVNLEKYLNNTEKYRKTYKYVK